MKRFKIGLGISVALTCVALASWASAYTNQARRRMAAGVASTTTKITAESTAPAFDDITKFKPVPDIYTESIATLVSSDFQIARKNAIVRGKVSLWERHPKMRYVWRLRVTDIEGDVFAGTTYLDQAFQVGDDGLRQASFVDSVPLPRGKSRTELLLYSLHADEDLSTFDRDGSADRHVLLREFWDASR